MSSAQRTWASRAGALLLAILVATLAAVAGMASTASAHNYVVSSTPADGDILTELPERFDVTTNAPLLDLGSGAAMQVTDAAGLFYGDGCVAIDGPSITMTAALGEAGPYSLTWQAVSEDGHTISGVIAFTWEPGEGAEASSGRSAAPVCGETEIEPSATPDDEADASPSPSAPAEDAESAPADSIMPWVVGGAIAVVGAIGVALLLTRRKD